MKKYFQSIAYIGFLGLSIGGLITAISSYENPFDLYENPLVWILIVMLALVIITKEYLSITVRQVTEKLKMEKEGIIPEEIDHWAWVQPLLKRFTKSRDIADDEVITLDHNYDGIRELDNVLPPWWLYLFYATMVFGVVYLVRFEIMGGDNQIVEYEKTLALAKIEIEEYKAANPNSIDIAKLEQLTDKSALAAGKKVFGANCVACHASDGGGGIGPNLTDKNWILGGGFKNVINTIVKGGRDGKGMVSWKGTLKPLEIQKVASYVLSLQGTTPAKPKEPQGEIWTDKK